MLAKLAAVGYCNRRSSARFFAERRVVICNGYNKGSPAMSKYECDLCGYVYDPEVGDPDNGIEPGTAFADLPEDWVCPDCGAGKEDFSEL